MNKHLNNKGYMLIEIVLAMTIAMVVIYFITNLTIKLKNKNDDLLVRTLVTTDQAIMYNTIMKDVYSNPSIVDCNYIKNKLGGNLKIENNVFKYGTFTNVISEYAQVGNIQCSGTGKNISLIIPMEVPQLEDNFDVIIGTEFTSLEEEEEPEIPDNPVNPEIPDEPVVPDVPEGATVLSCTLSANGTTNVITASVNNSKTLLYSGWDSAMVNNNGVLTKNITAVGTFSYYVKDNSGKIATCSISIEKTKKTDICPDGYYDCQGGSCDCYQVKSATSEAYYTGDGSCTCRDQDASSVGYTWGVCVANSGCSCAPGLIVKTNSCTKGTKYSCSSGYSLSGSSCYKYKDYIGTEYSCSTSGYTKLNNTYCYK